MKETGFSASQSALKRILIGRGVYLFCSRASRNDPRALYACMGEVFSDFGKSVTGLNIELFLEQKVSIQL